MERTFAKSSNLAFGQFALIIIAASGLTFFLLLRIYQKIYLYFRILLHKIETDCGCTQMTQLIAMHPFIFGTFIALSIIILAFIFYTVYKLVRLLTNTKKFTAQYLVNIKTNHSAKLTQAIINLSLDHVKVIEIRNSKPVAFCFGLWRPRICISNGLIKILRQDELEAVLLHEQRHVISKEPIKLLIIKYFHSIFFFLPGINTHINKYLTYSELAADELATINFTDRSKLARALYKISETEEKQILGNNLALSFFSSVIAQRVNRLSDDAYKPEFKLWGKGFVFGLCSVAMVILTAFIFLMDSNKAFAMHSNGSCLADSKVSSDNLTCNLESNEQICTQNNNKHQDMASCDMN